MIGKVRVRETPDDRGRTAHARSFSQSPSTDSANKDINE
jgi:hypothetical protein